MIFGLIAPTIKYKIQNSQRLFPSDVGFRATLPTLETEYRFWMQNRSVSLEKNGKTHVLNRYNVEVMLPRCVCVCERDQPRFANVLRACGNHTSRIQDFPADT